MSQEGSLFENGITYPHRAIPNHLQLRYLPDQVPFFKSSEHASNFYRLFYSQSGMKPMTSSLAPDGHAMRELGISEFVYAMFNRAKLNIDLIFGLPSYKPLVYEFLASFDSDWDNGWSFRIQNKDYHWTRAEVCQRLGFPEGGVDYAPSEEEKMETWKNLTNTNGFGRNSSTLFINSAAWRYVHRLIAAGINCSPETVHIVTEDDLILLCSIEQGKPINWFHRFSDKFLAMQSEFGAFDFVGGTSVITAIAEMCNYRFYCMPTEYKKLDMHMIRRLTILAQDASVGTPREESEHEEDRTHLERIRTIPEGPSNKRKKKRAKKAKKEPGWKEVKMTKTIEYRRIRNKLIRIDSD